MLQANILAADLLTLAIRLQVITLGLIQNPHSVHWHKIFEKTTPPTYANCQLFISAF